MHKVIHKNILLVSLFTVLASFSAVTSVNAQDKPTQPNIVVIFSDDHGFQDIKALEAKGQDWIGKKDWETPFETPFMDNLIASGMNFTQGYSAAPVCAPSRGSLLTGQSPMSLGRPWVVGGKPPVASKTTIVPFFKGRMSEQEITIAEALNFQGYISGHSGKWHAAQDHSSFPNSQDQGFHHFFQHSRGVTTGGKGDRNNPEFWDSDTKDYSAMYARNKLGEHGFPMDFPDDDVTTAAVDFIQKGIDEEKPFFLYLATWLVHTPIHTRNRSLLDYYNKKMFGSDKTLADLPAGALDDSKYLKQKNPYYASMVTTLDWTVGNVVDKLRQTDDPRWPGHKLIENTYIFFTSDNGGLENHSTGHLTDNYPLDEGKRDLQEGGIHVPFFIAGPGIKKGSIEETPVIHYDIYPTILELAEIAKSQDHWVEGISLAPLLFQTDKSLKHTEHPYFKDAKRDVLVWFANKTGKSAIRKGGWKLIKNHNNKEIFSNSKTPAYTLHQLFADDGVTRVDLEEQKNLAAKHPEKVKELSRILAGYQNAFEYGDPNHISPAATTLTPEYKTYQAKIPTLGTPKIVGHNVVVDVTKHGSDIKKAFILFNKDKQSSEWFRRDANVNAAGNQISIKLPARTDNFRYYVIDEHNFLISTPAQKANVSYSPCEIPKGYTSNAFPVMTGDECYSGLD
jgi:arylsulfatase A-like enzyme